MSELAYVSYRPARVGFLVRPGVVGDVVDAARLNTLLWGGLWNPLIAVPNAADAERWLARFRVDLLHAIADTEEIHAVVAAHAHLGWPMGDDGLMRVRYGEEAAEPTLLDIAPAMEDFHAARGWAIKRSQFRLFEWGDDDELAPLFAVRFGELHGDTGARYRGMFKSLLRGATVRRSEVDFGEKHVPSPIDVTAFSLRDDFVGRARQGVAVGDPRSADALRDYWNLRAGGYEVDFFVGEDLLDRALEQRLVRHRHRLAELREWERHVHVFRLGGAAVPERVQQLLDGLETVVYEDVETAWSADSPPTMAVTESHDVLAGTDSLGESRPVIQLPLTEKPFPRTDLSLITQFWIASVATPTDPAGGTIRMPYLPRLNRRFWGEVTLKLREIRAEWQRTGVLTSASDTHLTLQPLGSFQLLNAIFAEAGLLIERSQSSRAVAELIRQLGHLQRARVFGLPGVRRLVESRAAHTGLAFSTAAETIRSGFTDAEPLYVSGERLTEPADVFRFLLERRLFIAGLELRCPRCEHASTFAPRDLDDELRCPKCGEPFLLAPTLRGDPWRFQITGLLEQRAQHVFPNDPEPRPPEAPAVLLTLVWLHDAAVVSGPLWDTNLLVRGDEIDFEVDVAALELGEHGEVSLALGECRSRRGFTDRDIERLERVGERLRAIGVEIHLLFATLRDDFEADEIERFRDLRDRERIGERILPLPPILLTRRDLDTTWFAATQERFHGYARGELARFAAASDSVYLQ